MKNHFQLVKNHFFSHLDTVMTLCESRFDEETFKTEMFAIGEIADAYDPAHFASLYPSCIYGYYLPDSPYYHDPKLLENAIRILTVFRDRIHEDGSLDLNTTNFHDPAQTGFVTKGYFTATEILDKFSEHTELEDRLYALVLDILSRLGEAMATLGFHTPNHRWVISAGLATAYRYTKNQKFRDAIDRFLMEGIDCDENGEYTERSTGSYNIICDHAFTVLSMMLDDPSFLEYPRRNLNLMMNFTEPDMTVNTLNSTRWDQGGQYNIAAYYTFYLLLALTDKNPEFAYTADKIMEHFQSNRGVWSYENEILNFFMLHPEMEKLQDELIPVAPDPDKTRFLPKSNIARIYRPKLNMTMTVIATRSPVLFQMNYGSEMVQVRFAGSFFGDPHSQFRARTIEQTEDGFRLICDESAGYRSQLDEKPETSEWRRMDHSKRKIINVQNFRTEITVHLLDDGATFDVATFGCEGIPTKFEIAMTPGGKLDTGSIVTIPKGGDYLFLKEGGARYFLDGRRYIEIDGGFFAHTNGKDMRGAHPVDERKVTLAMTSVTPQRSTVTIRAKKIY